MLAKFFSLFRTLADSMQNLYHRLSRFAEFLRPFRIAPKTRFVRFCSFVYVCVSESLEY